MKTRIFLAFLGVAASVTAGPVTRDQLVAMARGKVDPGVMRAIVERDCVDFDVDAGNAAELSRVVPAPVLEAAIACRGRAAKPPAAPAAVDRVPPAPAAAAAPAVAAEAAAPAPPSATATATATAPAPVSPVPAAAAPPASAAGPSKIRLRALFIGESGALRCTASIDGVEAATLLKEEQGAFGEAVPRDKIGRETGYFPVSPGAHHVVFRCDPRAQAVAIDVDTPAGESRTIEIGETTLRNWKLRRIQTP